MRLFNPRPAGVAVTAVMALLLSADFVQAADAKKTPRTPAEQAALTSGALSEADVALNCKRMAGKIKIRLLELRSGGPSRSGSAAAQGIQSALTPIFGGTKRGADTQADASSDIARLRAMTEISKSRKCPYYDVDAELAQPATARSPQFVRAGTGRASSRSGGTGSAGARKAGKKVKTQSWQPGETYRPKAP